MSLKATKTSDDKSLAIIIKVVFCILYALIFACGIAGNVVVCVAVVRGKQLHNVTNFFIMNLAISGTTNNHSEAAGYSVFSG